MLLRSARLKSLVFGLGFFLLYGSVAHAQFTLTIDAVGDTWAFSGTDTGAGEATGGPPGSSIVQFEGLNANILFGFDQSFGPSFSSAGLNNSVTSANLGYRQSFGGSNAFAEFFFTLDTTDTQTITADGTEVSFASVSATDQLSLEALIGTTLSLQQGTGFSPISVVAATAVPEPSTSVVLLSALCPLALMRKRKS